MISMAIKGTLNTKTPEAAMELFEEIAMNSYQWHNFRAKSSKLAHVYDIDVVTAMAVQLETLSKKINGLAIAK